MKRINEWPSLNPVGSEERKGLKNGKDEKVLRWCI